jgi:hypothetical protein
MDPNVKLWGLKYNFGKVQGCFFAKFQALAIFYNYQIIFLLKTPWNRSTVSWTGSMAAHRCGP